MRLISELPPSTPIPASRLTQLRTTAAAASSSHSQYYTISQHHEVRVQYMNDIARQHQVLRDFVNDDANLSPYSVHIMADGMYVWSPTGSMGWCVGYEDIVMHALQRNPVALYVQLQGDGEDDEGDQLMMELALVPSQSVEAEEMFLSLSECSSAHPLLGVAGSGSGGAGEEEEVVDFGSNGNFDDGEAAAR